MPEPRLTSEFQISALKRLIEADGGFLTVIHKGDSKSGAILLIGQAKGQNPVLFERIPSFDGGASWQAATALVAQNDAEVSVYWKKRAARDPDLWVIELDVASSERLTGLLAASA